MSREPTKPIPAVVESCGTCRCWIAQPGSTEQGRCHAEPPKTLIVPIPPQIQGAPISTIDFSAWPPTGANQWCAAWRGQKETEH